MKRIIALVDCDSFFVSCEQVVDKNLIDKSVCVIGSLNGCVLSRSKEAKKTGIKVGMPYFMAKKEYPEITYVSANMSLYDDISEQIMQCLKQFSPDIEIYSIDEAFLDITGTQRLYNKNYIEIIKMIKEEVKKETGISVSIGLSSSKTLAKLASDKAKDTDGIFHIEENEIQEVLKNTAIEEIWGIGRNNTKTLKQQGIFNAFDFVSQNDDWIKNLMGIVGIKLKQELLGICVSAVDNREKPPESIQKTSSLKKSTSDIALLKKELKKHIHRACSKLRRYDCACNVVRVMLRTKDFHIAFKKISLANPTNFELEISKTVNILFEEIYDKDVLYRSTGVMLEKFTPAESRQTALFEDKKIEKNFSLASTIDKIEEKFGKNSIKIGF